MLSPTRQEEIREEWSNTNHGKTLQQYLTPEQNEWIADFWLTILNQEVEKTIIDLVNSEDMKLDEGITYDANVDITDIPDMLSVEMTGVRKGWEAAKKNILILLREGQITK